MAGEHVVMHLAAHQYVGQGMAHLLADAEQADGLAFGGFVPAHDSDRPPTLPFPASGRGDRTHKVRARSSTSKTSRWSPGLMSLVSASNTPHSRPARTSATSSLNRRSEEMVVLE